MFFGEKEQEKISIFTRTRDATWVEAFVGLAIIDVSEIELQNRDESTVPSKIHPKLVFRRWFSFI